MTRRAKPSIKLAVIVFVFTTIVGVILLGVLHKIMNDYEKKSIIEYASQGADSIDARLNAQLDTLFAIASLEFIADPNTDLKIKLEKLDGEAMRKDFSRISLADKTGQVVTSDGKNVYVEDREYFKKAISGVANISDPIISRLDNIVVVIYAVPIIKNGNIYGVLYATQESKGLWKLTDKLQYKGNGKTFILDNEGYYVSDENYTLVSDRVNYVKEVSYNKGLDKFAELQKNMLQGQTGCGEYAYNGNINFMGYAPIKSTGWSLAVIVPRESVFGRINGIIVITGIILLFLILMSTIATIYFSLVRHRDILERNIARNAVDSAGIYIIELDMNGKIVSTNAEANEKLLSNYRGAIGTKFSEISGMNDNDLLMKLNERIHFETNMEEDSERNCYIRWNVINDNKKDKNSYVLMGIDITDKYNFSQKLKEKHNELGKLYNNLEETESQLRQKYGELHRSQEETKLLAERYMMVAYASKDAIWDWDGIENKLFVSDRFYELLGYSRPEDAMHFSSIMNLIHPDDVVHDRKTYIEHLTGKNDFYRSEYRLMTKNGGYKWFISTGKSILNAEGQVVRNVGTFTDITDRKLYEDEIRHLAYYDYLTGVPNRSYIVNELSSLLNKCVEDVCIGVVYCIDVDDFRIINETFGHTVGDSILLDISNRLKSISNVDIISRIGGDEFIIIQDELLDELSVQDIALDKANEIVNVFQEAFILADNKFDITCSIGIVIYPKDGTTVEEILKNAELAMYKAKEKGKDCFIMYDTSISDELSEKTEMERQLRGAIKNNEFSLCYQPQVNARTSEIVGFEALIRWKSPFYGNVSPVKFIPIAEEIGLIVEIGRWVMEKSFEFAKKIENKGICISVNVSTMQLVQSNFLEEVNKTYDMNGLSSGSVALEVTESCLVDSFSDVKEKLEKLQQKGLKIYLDDFGTGYSSLTYLKDLPIDVVKIDKSFVDNISHDGVERRIITTIISLSNDIGFKVVAEGVETKGQLDFLVQNNCEFIQGFYFSKPISEQEALDLVLKKEIFST